MSDMFSFGEPSAVSYCGRSPRGRLYINATNHFHRGHVGDNINSAVQRFETIEKPITLYLKVCPDL